MISGGLMSNLSEAFVEPRPNSKRPEIGLGELSWGCKYQQIISATSILVFPIKTKTYYLCIQNIIYILFGTRRKWVD